MLRVRINDILQTTCDWCSSNCAACLISNLLTPAWDAGIPPMSFLETKERVRNNSENEAGRD